MVFSHVNASSVFAKRRRENRCDHMRLLKTLVNKNTYSLLEHTELPINCFDQSYATWPL